MERLARRQVRELDRIAMEEFGVPGVVLMENAGGNAARLLQQLVITGPVVLLCGRGNNGGDGFVDALLGTGTEGPPRGAVATAIAALNAERRSGSRVLAVDLPSGLDADAGAAADCCVRADVTATFVAEKAGFANPAAAAFTGQVHVVGIGAPAGLLRRFGVSR